MQSITPCLSFDGQAEEAAGFYVEVFSSRTGASDRGPSKILDVSRYTDAGPGTPGSAMLVSFMLHGQEFQALNGGPHFTFNEAISFSVSCDTQEEIDELWGRLSADGDGQCGWVKDRYGVSWQIVPKALGELMGQGDSEARTRVMQALLGMKKLEISGLRRAHAGG